MKFVSLYIENFRSIKRVDIAEIDDACILVGKNNTGKSSVLDALLAVCGKFKVLTSHFDDPLKPIKIGVVLETMKRRICGSFTEARRSQMPANLISGLKNLKKDFPATETEN